MDAGHTLSGLLVGLLVGFTGVGGGSLMAPILILIFGIAPATAVGTDLWFAGITKTIGGAIHQRKGSADLKVVRRLCIGSIPAAIATILVLNSVHEAQVKQGWLTETLGIVLLLTAIATFARPALHRYALEARSRFGETLGRFQLVATIIAGILLGILVTLTSVGAGALAATMLVFLYPLRLPARKIVGTDIVHAIPLTLVGGLGHLWMGSVDGHLLLWLLIGSIPGIIIGSLLVHRSSDRLVRLALGVVLILAGARLIAT